LKADLTIMIRDIIENKGWTQKESAERLAVTQPRVSDIVNEWKDPDGSRMPIVVDDVLRFMGKTIEEIAAIRQEAAREAYLDEVLSA
jgi:predicted transcriptional regulator